MKGEYRINVAKVPQGGRKFEFPVTPKWIEEHLGDCEIYSPFDGGTLSVVVTPLRGGYFVKGTATVKFKMTCSRCLGEAVVAMVVPISVVMVKEGTGHLLPEGEKDDVGVARYFGEELVLDEEVREAILLELPMNPLCGNGCSTEDLYKG